MAALTNYNKFSSFKQHTFILSKFCGSEVPKSVSLGRNQAVGRPSLPPEALG